MNMGTQNTCVTPCPMQPSLPLREHRSEEHTSELQSNLNIVCRLLLEKKKDPTRLAADRPRLPRAGNRLLAKLIDGSRAVTARRFVGLYGLQALNRFAHPDYMRLRSLE